MNTLKLPFKVPKGYKLKITQPYGDTSTLAWYQANGINIPFHNGVDIVVVKDGMEEKMVTYGLACLTPDHGWEMVSRTYDTPLSTKGNGCTLLSPEFTENGERKKLALTFWHCSEVKNKKGVYLLKGEEVACIGNSGLVYPQPSKNCVYCGSHVHLMMYEYKYVNGSFLLQNANNGVKGAIDPMSRFSLESQEEGDTDVSKDLPPIQFYITGIRDLITFFRNVFR